MPRGRQRRQRISWTFTVLLGTCVALILVGLVAAVLGFGGIVNGNIEIFGAKIGNAPVGVVLVVIGAVFAVALLTAWPSDWEEKGMPAPPPQEDFRPPAPPQDFRP